MADDTWLPVPDTHIHLAADKQEDDPSSTLNFTRAFLKWRKTQPTIAYGDLAFIDTNDDKLLAFRRKHNGETLVCVYNLGAAPKIFKAATATNILPADLPGPYGAIKDGAIALPSFGIFIGRE